MKKFLKTALAILPLAVMASCSDDPMPGNEGIVEKSETRYLRVTLRSADAAPDSRAPGDIVGDGKYDTGTNEENKIKTIEFYFYDADKNFHSYKSMNVADAEGDGETQAHPGIDDPKQNISGFYHCNVPITLEQGGTYPQYVICIINSVEGSQYQSHTMADAQAKTLGKVFTTGTSAEGKNEKYFGMSNSVYYGLDEVTGEKNALIMATPFKLEALKTQDEIDALEAKGPEELEKIAINIYVERYAVKVNLDISGTTYNDYQAGDGVTQLHFEPVAWTVNATEDKFFFLKAFRTKASETKEGYGTTYETFANMDELLFKGWNNEAHHRSFWARTPGYYANEYPLVADDITDTNKDYEVEYKSYNTATPLNGEKVVTSYEMETTMVEDRLTGSEELGDRYMPVSSIPSVVLIGKYRIVGKDQITDDIDFYAYGKTDGKYNFYVDDDQTKEKTGLDNIVDKMINDQTILLQKTVDKDGITTYPTYNSESIPDELRDKLVVEHPSKEVRFAPTKAEGGQANANDIPGIKVAADVVVLQIDKTKLTGTEDIWFYNAVAKEYEKVTTTNIDIVNRLLLQNLGGAHMYKDGMAFFSAPIQHWGWYRTGNVNAQPKEDGTAKTINDWDWKEMKNGDFGLVRNHVYTLKIGNISGLGTAIKDPDDPILPPADKVPYVVHFHVNIQKWAVLPTQNWNF